MTGSTGASDELVVVGREDALVVEAGDETAAAIPVDPEEGAERPVTTSYVHSIGTVDGRLTATFATDTAAAASHAAALLDTDESSEGWLGESPTSTALFVHETATDGDEVDVDDTERLDAVRVVAAGDRLGVSFTDEKLRVDPVGERETGRGR